MKTLFKRSVLAVGCSSLMALSPSFGADEIQAQKVEAIQYPAGTFENPIVLNLKDIKNVDTLEFALKEYVRKHYEGYRIIGTMFTMHGERFIEILDLTDDNGKDAMVYFDMTEAYKKLKTRGKQNRERIKELEDKHRPMTLDELLKRQKEREKAKGKPKK